MMQKVAKYHKWDDEQVEEITNKLMIGEHYHGKPIFRDEMLEILPNIEKISNEVIQTDDDPEVDLWSEFFTLTEKYMTSKSKVSF